MDDRSKGAIKLFDKFAQQYQDKYMDIHLYEESLDLLCDSIEKQQARVLDIACGPGNISRYLLSKRPDFQLHGIDLSPKMIELAKANNPSASFQLMDSQNIRALDQEFDAIICGFGLPYLSKEAAIQLIRDAADILPLNGFLYLSTMEDDYSKSGLKGPSTGESDRVYTYYHQADYLSAALRSNAFSITLLDRKQYPAADESITTDLLILAQKQA